MCMACAMSTFPKVGLLAYLVNTSSDEDRLHSSNEAPTENNKWDNTRTRSESFSFDSVSKPQRLSTICSLSSFVFCMKHLASCV